MALTHVSDILDSAFLALSPTPQPERVSRSKGPLTGAAGQQLERERQTAALGPLAGQIRPASPAAGLGRRPRRYEPTKRAEVHPMADRPREPREGITAGWQEEACGRVGARPISRPRANWSSRYSGSAHTGSGELRWPTKSEIRPMSCEKVMVSDSRGRPCLGGAVVTSKKRQRPRSVPSYS